MNENRGIITNILKELGIPANLKGYRYITYAIELLVDDMARINYVTAIYCDVAKKFETTSARTERAIRHAIEAGWSRGNVDLENKIFGYSVDIYKGKPTNAQFLATVADYILLRKEDEGK